MVFLVIFFFYVTSAKLGLWVENETGNKLLGIAADLLAFATLAFLTVKISHKIKAK